MVNLQRYRGEHYEVEIDFNTGAEEPTVFIYGQNKEFVEGAAWYFPEGLQHLQNPKAVDLLAQEIIEDSDSLKNELDREWISQEWVDLGNAEFVYGLGRDKLTLLQEFMYQSFGIIPYQAFGQYYPARTTMVQLPLPGFEDYQTAIVREYPDCEAVDIEQRIIDCLNRVRINVDEDNKSFREALEYLRSEEVEEYGRNYEEYHTKESELPSGSLELIKSYFP